MMRLIDVLDRISEFDEDQSIYVNADAGASGESEAVVAYETEEGDPPSTAGGMRYFLDVAIARDAIRVWSEWRDGAQPSAQQKLEAVLHYAEHDAFKPAD